MEARLKTISNILLQEPEDLGNVWRACALFKEVLLEYSEMDLQGDNSRSNLPLQQGMALGTTWAAYCLDDFLRTSRFIKGIHSAIRQVLSRNEHSTVHLLYAGTGPFATLMLPLTACFSPAELQCTLLEINPGSYDNLKKVLHDLDLTAYVRRFELVDAMQYQIPAGEKVDILLSETMQAGLRREAQVPIFRHLLRQAEAREAILIPERIELFLGAYNSRQLQVDHVNSLIKFGSYFCLDREHILGDQSEKRRAKDDGSRSTTQLTFPVSLDDQYDCMGIFTEIDIFQNQNLRLYESGLTMPLMIRDLRHDPVEGQKISISYSLQDSPGEIIAFENHNL